MQPGEGKDGGRMGQSWQETADNPEPCSESRMEDAEEGWMQRGLRIVVEDCGIPSC